MMACTSGRAISKKPFDIPFWLREGYSDDPRIVEVHPHCCCDGYIAIARITRMPEHDKEEALEPELVVELSDDGKILRRWSMPVNAIVAGIAGNDIIVPLRTFMQYDNSKGLRISPDGDFIVCDLPPNIPEPESYICPDLPEFEGSAYLRCWSMRDIKNGTRRLIAFQGPCT